MNYYDILELNPDASEMEIKKAYRRLALQYHPDRCPPSEKEAAAERFKAIGEAYQVLSDARRRAEYDAQSLHKESGSSVPSPYRRNYQNAQQHFDHDYSFSRNQPFMDPFVQFDHLFRQDDFFREAFSGMEEEFAQRFDSSSISKSNIKHSSPRNLQTPSSSTTRNFQQRSTEGWIPWLLRQCGIQFTMTSYSTDAHGNVSATNYSSSSPPSGRRQDNPPSYTNQSTRTVRDQHGRLVTIRSMERNGNLLEEVLVEGRLAERRVNGQLVDVGIMMNQSVSTKATGIHNS